MRHVMYVVFGALALAALSAICVMLLQFGRWLGQMFMLEPAATVALLGGAALFLTASYFLGWWICEE